MLNSIWAGQVRLPEFAGLDRDLKTDVLIIGGGLAGLLCAHRLHRDGVAYVLIEADRIMGGISRNTTAKLTCQHGLIYDKLLRRFGPEHARVYLEANQAALEQYRQLSQNIDCDFETKDNYIYSTDSASRLEAELAALQRLGFGADFVEQPDLPFDTAGAVRFRDQAQFHPLKFAAGLCEGLNIFEHTPARSFHGNTVYTGRGRITAEKIIVATHFPILNKHGGYFLKMYQERSYVLALHNDRSMDGMYLDEAGRGPSVRKHAQALLLGGEAHRTGKPGDGWAGLERLAREHYPDSPQLCRWAAQDCITLDDVPYIGQYSRATPGLYVATGFNKWGMTSSMVSAMILGDLLQGKENPWARTFSPDRSSLRPRLFANAWSAAANLLTPTTPRCPHLGCALKWNPREHSWDCPCHGSRFTRDGKLLDGPATGDLKR